MDFIKENLFKMILIIVIFIVTSSFYWYEWRPSQIRKDCSLIQLDDKEINLYNKIEELKSIIIDNKYRKATELEYNHCIHSKGL